MTPEVFENLIIGSGESGKYLAWTLAKMGQRTVVVERSLIGGSCPNIACLPSKNVIHSAKVVSLFHRAAEFGVATGPLNVDMAGVFHRKKKMVDDLVELHLDRYRTSGVELLMGEARFVEPRTVQVTLNSEGTRVIRGDRVFLNIGSRASLPNVPGLVEARPMTHVEALNLQRSPEHLVVLGGGYIAVEFAQAIRRFGSRVTLIQRGRQLLSREDPDCAEALLQLLKDEGVEVRLETTVSNVSGRSGERVQVNVQSASGTETVEASDILVATGRAPNSDCLNVEKGGIELDSHGYIRVNEKLETSAANVWAMGDCAGSPQFTHVAFDDFRIVRDNLAGGSRSTRDRLIPFCLFSDPELARVGITESEARAKNVRYRLAKMPMSAVLRTRTTSETRGFMKALIADNDRILGFMALGAEATELMAAVQTAMLGDLPYTVLRDGIFAHPTTAEGIVFLFANVPPAST